MPVTQNQVDALKKFIGQGEVFTGVTKPADGVIMGFEQAYGLPLGGVSVGLTSGEATLEYKPEFAGVEVEQAYGEVAPRVKKETVTLKFKCAEATYARIKVALSTATETVLVAGTAPDTARRVLLTVGGKTFFDPQCVALVSNIGTYTHQSSINNLYEWVCLYSAISVDGLTLEWKRGETRMIEVTMTGYADVTRTEGDQLFQFVQQRGT